MEIKGSTFTITLDELRESDPRLAIDWQITGSGDATSQCEYILSQYDIDCDPEQARAYLLPYGAWGEDELQDHSENMLKLVWLIGCDLGEHGAAYLSAY